MRRALVAVVTLGLAIGLAACEDTDPVVPGGPTAAPATAAPTATGALPQGVVDVSDTTTVLSAVPLDTVPTTEKPFLGELIDWCVEGQLAACDQVTRWADSDEVYTFGALCGYRLSGVREIM
nr:hypothetical protein [Actinomycetales bacterium]